MVGRDAQCTHGHEIEKSHVNQVSGLDRQLVPSVIQDNRLLIGQGYNNRYMQSRVREVLWLDSYRSSQCDTLLRNNWHKALTIGRSLWLKFFGIGKQESLIER